MEILRKGDYLGTYNGGKFFPIDPRPEDVNINDIAHALSNICRFNGHTKKFYSVADHSLNVEAYLDFFEFSVETRLYGLLHDASEAYICDIPRPLKGMLPGYKEIECNVQKVILQAFGLPEPDTTAEEMVKIADDFILSKEAYTLMNNANEWNLPYEDLSFKQPTIYNDNGVSFEVKFHQLMDIYKRKRKSKL